jgi:putative ABC transport system permease protein
MLKNYFKTAWRTLLRNKFYGAINIIGIAIGISCSLVIFTWIKYELSFDESHSGVENTYRIVEQHRSANGVQYWNTTANPLAAAVRNDFPDLKITQTYGPVHFIASSDSGDGINHRFAEDKLLFADQDFFDVFDFKNSDWGGKGHLWIAGSPSSAFRNPNSIVVTERFADRYFPGAKQKEALLGRTVTLDIDGPVLFSIGGVIRNTPANSSIVFDALINYAYYKTRFVYNATNWSGNYLGTTYALLPGHVRPQTIEQALIGFKKKYLNAEDDKNITWYLQPLKDIHTQTLYGGGKGSYVVSKNTLFGLAALGLFLILIASFNFINLSTAQAMRRNKEIGIRKVVGGTQRQLFVQFMVEMLLITTIATLLSISLLQLLLNFVNRQLAFINVQLHANPGVLLFSLGLILLLALIAGLYPSLLLSRYNPIDGLKNVVKGRNKRDLNPRKALIIFQFGITFFLISCTLVISDQMHYVLHKDLGFNKNAIITLPIPDTDSTKLELFRARLLRDPRISNLSYASGSPITGNNYGTSYRLPNEPVSMMRQGEMKVVDIHYYSLYKLQLLAGQWLGQSNKVSGKFNGFVVNEALLSQLGLKPREAIGKELIINEGKAPIIGVVKDFHNSSLQQKISPCLLFYWGSGFFGEAGIQLASAGSDLPQTLTTIQATWKEVFPNGVYSYEFLDQSLAKNYFMESLILEAVQVFAGISILISCLGLFGLMLFLAVKRKKEIGIRKVLGSSNSGIVALLLKDFLVLVLIAICITSPLSYWASDKWLQDFAYRISIGWSSFVLAGFLSIGISLLTILFQAVKAAMVNPISNLKTE